MRQTKALFLAPSLSRRMGGIHEIMRGVSQELHKLGVQVDAFGVEDKDWESDRHLWGEVSARAFPYIGPRAFVYSPELANAILDSNADLLHLHALWMYTSTLASKWKKDRKRPYIVTPNGMLEPWALQNSGWKKQIAGLLYEKGMLHGASCLQANTEKELHDIRAYGLKNSVAIIPNGVYLPGVCENQRDLQHLKNTPCDYFSQKRTTSRSRNILLFLGRIHPKKGIKNAIRAWNEVKIKERTEWCFVIAGWDQLGHQLELMNLCRELGLRFTVKESHSFGDDCYNDDFEVVFYGEVFGQEKETLFRSASAFILPSLSEGLPMSVLEAWSYSLPVVMTTECNLPIGFSVNAARKIDSNETDISVVLCDFFQMNSSDLKTMGARGRELVASKFTWEVVGRQMKEVYDWMLGGGSVPECVIRCS